MAATPFTGILACHERATGKVVNLRMAFSDVANAFATFTDLNAIAQLSIPKGTGGYVIDDFTLSAAGVDTTAIQVRKQTTDTPIILRDSQLANLTTDVVSRCQGLRGRLLEEASYYFFKQLA